MSTYQARLYKFFFSFFFGGGEGYLNDNVLGWGLHYLSYFSNFRLSYRYTFSIKRIIFDNFWGDLKVCGIIERNSHPKK